MILCFFFVYEALLGLSDLHCFLVYGKVDSLHGTVLMLLRDCYITSMQHYFWLHVEIDGCVIFLMMRLHELLELLL